MKIDVFGDMDNRPGSIFRALIESLLGPHWDDYVTVYIEEQNHLTGVFFSKYALHNEAGPATVKQDGTMEWWLNGKKLFCNSQQEFECYMRNKAFW
jgi:hypothetical protein